MGSENVDLVRGAYEAFGRGDVEAVLAAFTDDIEWHEAEGMPYGGVYRGPQEIAEKVFGAIIEDIPDFVPKVEEIVAKDDLVMVLCRYTGTGKATGKQLDLPVAHAWDIRDGRLSRFRQFIDTVKFAEVVPSEAAATA